MATSFKALESGRDSVVTRNLLHEAIPITGSIVSGTYANENIKEFSHGMFQSVYDYPFLSSSANHIVDLTVGYSAVSGLSGTEYPAAAQQAKKINIYNQMAQVLVGYNENGAIRRFDDTEYKSKFDSSVSYLRVKKPKDQMTDEELDKEKDKDREIEERRASRRERSRSRSGRRERSASRSRSRSRLLACRALDL